MGFAEQALSALFGMHGSDDIAQCRTDAETAANMARNYDILANREYDLARGAAGRSFALEAGGYRRNAVQYRIIARGLHCWPGLLPLAVWVAAAEDARMPVALAWLRGCSVALMRRPGWTRAEEAP